MFESSDLADPLTRFLAARAGALISAGGCTKRTAVRLAIMDAIVAGRVSAGALLPSERALAEEIGVSLGTVQAALSELVQAGAVTRKRGDGTRVRADTESSEHAWHFRFLGSGGVTRLAVHDLSVRVDRTWDAGPYANFLGFDDDGYVCIHRIMRLSNGGEVRADMALLHRRAPRLDEMPEIELYNMNLRALLQRAFGVVSTHVAHRVGVMEPHLAQTAGFTGRGDAPVFDLRAMVSGPDGAPVYHQRILCSTADCQIELESVPGLTPIA